jgi:hypothetical protein
MRYGTSPDLSRFYASIRRGYKFAISRLRIPPELLITFVDGYLPIGSIPTRDMHEKLVRLGIIVGQSVVSSYTNNLKIWDNMVRNNSTYVGSIANFDIYKYQCDARVTTTNMCDKHLILYMSNRADHMHGFRDGRYPLTYYALVSRVGEFNRRKIRRKGGWSNASTD